MKGLSFLEKIIVVVNSLAALLLLMSYGLSFLPPKQYGLLSVLSLGVPVFIILNLVFALYWLLKLKKQVLISLVVLLLGFNSVTSMYQFTSDASPATASSFTLMSYNVRLFNLFEWIEDEELPVKISAFIEREQPDILSFQEYHLNSNLQLDNYYKYESLTGEQVKGGQAIYSKFPIIKKGAVGFPDTSNDAIFVDVVKGEDTLRIYNVHLQSSKINTSVESLKKESSENLLKRISSTFQMQQSQTELFLQHLEKSPHKSIITGDFNNTPYSYVYSEIKGDYQDAFEIAGKGFGSTYNFKFFPFRIDFIMVGPEFQINTFDTYGVEFSDHYPIRATLDLHE